MPEGVEHALHAEPRGRVLVTLAVMPEGVEHKLRSYFTNPDTAVTLAVMPEGVEHPKEAGSTPEESRSPSP